MNIISRPPSNQPEVKIGALYGNYNQRQVQLGFSDAIIPDKLSFRLSGVYSAQDGYVEDTNGRDLNYRSGISGRGVIRWQPTENLDVTFTALGTGNRDGDAPYVPPDADNPFVTEPYNIDGTLDFSQNTQALKVAYDNPNFSLTSITSHRFYNLTSISDGDYTSTDLLRIKYVNEADQWTQEVRLQSPNNADRFRWILGGYLESRQTENIPEEIEYTETAAAAFGLPSAGSDRTTSSLDQNTYAAFGQIDYKPINPLTLTAGLRYESFDNEIDRNRVFEAPGSGETPGGLELNGEKSDGDIVLPKFAVEYSFNRNISAYGSAGRGDKPGTLSYRAEDINLLEIRPEKSWNYEIGLKSSWLKDRLTANLAFFWTEVDDYQAVLPDEFGLQRNIVNAGANINGLELEATAKPIKGLDLIAGFGYVNSEFSDYTNPFTGQDFSGNKLLYAPEYTYNLAAQYKSPGGIFGRLELQGSGKIFFDDANQLSQDPYALVNGRIGYEGKNYGIYLFANNIFDKEYQTSLFIFPPPNVVSSFGDRATYGVQVRAEF